MRDEATRHNTEQSGHAHHHPGHQPGHHHHGGGGHEHGGGHHHQDGGSPEHRGGRHFRGGGGGPGRDHSGSPRGRARRGEARTVLLDALRDGPKHGYEIIKALDERSSGRYTPSPGTVYPTMQLLEDQGLVRADQQAERRVYGLTEAGRADLESHSEEVADFWARFAGPSGDNTDSPEIGFLRDALDDLERTVWRGVGEHKSPETVGRVRQAVEHCQNSVREVLSASGSGEKSEPQ